MDNVQCRVTGNMMKDDTQLGAGLWSQIKTHKIRTNPRVFHSCCISLSNIYLFVGQRFYIFLYLFPYKISFFLGSLTSKCKMFLYRLTEDGKVLVKIPGYKRPYAN